MSLIPHCQDTGFNFVLQQQWKTVGPSVCSSPSYLYQEDRFSPSCKSKDSNPPCLLLCCIKRAVYKPQTHPWVGITSSEPNERVQCSEPGTVICMQVAAVPGKLAQVDFSCRIWSQTRPHIKNLSQKKNVFKYMFSSHSWLQCRFIFIFYSLLQ